MGTETSILQGCDLEEPLETPSQQDWTIHPAKRNDGSRVSVFVHKKTEQQNDKRIEHAAKQLKILRHPTILKFFASCKNVEGTYLITELVKPLELVLDNLTSEEICAGMYNVVEALSFLHERGGVSHNNVYTSSIYVSQDGGWRLGGMEQLCKFHEATIQFLEQMCPMRNSKIIPPEEQEKSTCTLSAEFGHARDAYAFGVLAQELLAYLGELGDIAVDFSTVIEQFLNPDPTQRPKLKTLLCNKLFKNDFLQIINFLNNITIKSESEKTLFFKSLVPKLLELPSSLVAARLVPKLLTRFVMADFDAVEYVFPHLFTPNSDPMSETGFQDGHVNPILPVQEFKESIIPIIEKIICVRETHVRLALLKYFASYVHLFDTDVLRKTILPQMLLGLRDSNDGIVSSSLHALAEIVSILGGKTVVGGPRRKLFLDGRPKFHHQQESPITRGDKLGNLTAVSGVISLPKLLKATGSQGVNHSNEEKELALNKQAEREKRKLEAKRKAEEKRLEREKRKQEQHQRATLATKVIHDESILEKLNELETIVPSEEEITELDLTHISEVVESDNFAMATKETELQIEDESWSDWGDIDQSESVATEAKEQEKVKEDWSNWGDDEKGDETLLDEPKSTVAKKQAGAMKIKSAAKKSNSSPGSSNVSPRDEKQQKGGKNVTPKDLGKEFEIPDITAKLPDPEPDFFADMVPTVKSNVVSLDELMKSSKSKSKTTKEMSNKEREAIEAEIEAELSASFGAIETTDELETGWGDDDLNLDVQAEEET